MNNNLLTKHMSSSFGERDNNRDVCPVFLRRVHRHRLGLDRRWNQVDKIRFERVLFRWQARLDDGS